MVVRSPADLVAERLSLDMEKVPGFQMAVRKTHMELTLKFKQSILLPQEI